MLTEGEAQALNALRAENIRNNVDQIVVRCIAPDGTLSAEDQVELQEIVAGYDQRYQFRARAPAQARPSAIEIAARELAEEKARFGGYAEGQEFTNEVSRLEMTLEIQREARRRVALAREETERMLGQL